MKGEIFNIIEKFIVESFGEKTFEIIYQAALPNLETKEPFVGPKTYPDKDLITLHIALIQHLSLNSDEILFKAGKFAFKLLAEKIPTLMATYHHPRDLLLSLNDVIHVEVKKIYPGAITPEFKTTLCESGDVIMEYRSPRKLYTFAEGLIYGCGDYFGIITKVTTNIDTDQLGEYGIFHVEFKL